MLVPATGKGENKRPHLYILYIAIRLALSLIRSLVNIVKVLGEGGFSFVYLAQDEHSGVRMRYE